MSFLSKLRGASADSKKLEEDGSRQALRLFHEAAEHVPAYRNFLSEHKINPHKIKSLQDFAGVPFIDKANYISKYSLKERCWGGKADPVLTFEMSTGSTGQPFYWPLSEVAERRNFEFLEYSFTNYFNLAKHRTLVLNCFSMGAWAAGTIVDSGIKYLGRKGYPVSLFSPGFDIGHAIRLIQQNGAAFDQIIIGGYWKSARAVIDMGRQEGIDWSKFKVRLFHGGEAYPEAWRANIIKDAQTDSFSDLNYYANSEIGLMAMETPLTITARQYLAQIDPTLGGRIPNSESREPSLQQYNPLWQWFELSPAEDGLSEIVITADNAAPLVRYNTHDFGGVISFEDLSSAVDAPDEYAVTPWPAVYVFARQHTSVTFYGLKIYQEHFVTALEDPELRPYIGRGYLAAVNLVEGRKKTDTRLELTLELAPRAKLTKKLNDTVTIKLVENLKKVNSAFDKLTNELGEEAYPHCVFRPHGDPVFKGAKQTATKVGR